MCSGESGLGKSTLINALFLTNLYPDRELPDAEAKVICCSYRSPSKHTVGRS